MWRQNLIIFCRKIELVEHVLKYLNCGKLRVCIVFYSRLQFFFSVLILASEKKNWIVEAREKNMKIIFHFNSIPSKPHVFFLLFFLLCFFFFCGFHMYTKTFTNCEFLGNFSSFNILNTDSTRINFCYPHFGVDKYDELNKLHNYVAAGVYMKIFYPWRMEGVGLDKRAKYRVNFFPLFFFLCRQQFIANFFFLTKWWI